MFGKFEPFSCVTKAPANDLNIRTDSQAAVECNDVVRFHTYAPIAYGPADVAFLRGAVNINVTSVGVAVMSLLATQPDNATDDGVAPGRIGFEHFPCAFAAFKNST